MKHSLVLSWRSNIIKAIRVKMLFCQVWTIRRAIHADSFNESREKNRHNIQYKVPCCIWYCLLESNIEYAWYIELWKTYSMSRHGLKKENFILYWCRKLACSDPSRFLLNSFSVCVCVVIFGSSQHSQKIEASFNITNAFFHQKKPLRFPYNQNPLDIHSTYQTQTKYLNSDFQKKRQY